MAMFWKKRKKDIHQLIFDIAEYSRDSDLRDLYTRLAELELYAPAVSANFTALDGEKLVIGDGMRIGIPTMEIQGYQLAVFFVEKTDKRLGPRFIGMSVAEAFGMVEKGTLAASSSITIRIHTSAYLAKPYHLCGKNSYRRNSVRKFREMPINNARPSWPAHKRLVQ